MMSCRSSICRDGFRYKRGKLITNALIAAIEEDNEGVIVEDFAVYKKVKVPGKMVVNRETVEEHLGADFDMDQVHMADVFMFRIYQGLGRRTSNHPMG